MKEIDELTKEELVELVKGLQKDCRHLNAQLAIAEMAISGMRSFYQAQIEELNNNNTKKTDNNNGN